MAIAQIYNPNNKITITESAINHFKTVINENNAVSRVRLGSYWRRLCRIPIQMGYALQQRCCRR